LAAGDPGDVELVQAAQMLLGECRADDLVGLRFALLEHRAPRAESGCEAALSPSRTRLSSIAGAAGCDVDHSTASRGFV
jgi:hypothetical protein